MSRPARWADIWIMDIAARRSRWVGAIARLVVGACAAAGSLAGAQTISVNPPVKVAGDGAAIRRPEASGRVVKVFDFEERETNPGDVPRDWFRDQDDPQGRRRVGFPPWNQAKLSYVGEEGEAFAGVGSVYLPTRGGSTSLLLAAGAVPIFPSADHRVHAKVRTVGLQHARGVLVARVLDKGGKTIVGSEVRSLPLVTGGEWVDANVEIIGSYDDAAWMQLELLLLQPAQLNPAVTDPTRVEEADYQGGVFFDEVSIEQLPRVEISTESPANIVLSSEAPALRMLVRDLAGEALTMEARVYDVEGRELDRMTRDIAGGSAAVRWQPRVTRLGWYRGIMNLIAGGRVVGGASVDFVWMYGASVISAPGAKPTGESASEDHGQDRGRFGLVYEHLPAGMRDLVVPMVSRAGVGNVSLPVWDDALLPTETAGIAKAFGPMLNGLNDNWTDVTLSLPRVPLTLAASAQVDVDDPWSALVGDAKIWTPYGTDLFDVLGQRVGRWRVGGIGDMRNFWRMDKNSLGTVRSALSRLMPTPTLLVGGRLDQAWRIDDGERVAVLVPSAMTPEGVGQAVASWRGALHDVRDASLDLVFECADATQVGEAAGAGDLVKRAVYLWANAGDIGSGLAPGLTLSLLEPWSWDASRRPQANPKPELAAWRALLERLGERRVVGRYPAGEGVVAFILAPMAGAPADRGGALVVWNESSDAKSFRAYLGEGPMRLLDVFGNATGLPLTTDAGSRPGVDVPVGVEPVFVEGIDVDLVRCLASMAIDPPILESGGDQQDLALVVSNPWPVTLSGRFAILEPGGFETGRKDRSWKISPRGGSFTVQPGRTERVPISVSFSPSEEAGEKQFVLDLQLAAERTYASIEISRPVELGLRGLKVDLSAVQADGAGEVRVDVRVANTGGESRSLGLTVFAPGLPRSKGGMPDLGPGRQTTKRFVFSAKDLRGQRVLVSVEDPEASLRVTRSAVVR
ncbi:MAG: hypothetical protein WC718_11840 [Phycisphaerales bacterium]